MAFRWFVGLDLDSPVWDPSTFSKNREHRFDQTDVLEHLFDDTVKAAMEKGWVSLHWSVDGTPVRANAGQKSFVPIEVLEKPEDYRKAIRGQKRSNKRHRSTADPDARIATKSSKETPIPAYTVNAIMENRNRILTGIGVEVFGGRAERDGAERLLDRVKRRLGLRPRTLGGDKGYFVRGFIQGLLDRGIEPHVAAPKRGPGSSAEGMALALEASGGPASGCGGVIGTRRGGSPAPSGGLARKSKGHGNGRA